MTVADDLATLRARIAKSRATYVPGTPERYPAAELRGFTVLEAEALIESVEAEIARLADAASESKSGLVTRLMQRAEAAEAEVAGLRDGLRPFVEDYDFHAADYLADDSDARVFTARTVESLIADQRKARALLADDGAAQPLPRSEYGGYMGGEPWGPDHPSYDEMGQ